MLNKLICGVAALGALLTVTTVSLARDRDADMSDLGSEPAGSVIEIHTGSSTGQIAVSVDKSQVVRFDRAFREINVGSKDIAAVVPLSRSTAVIVGKKRGTTNLTLIDGSGHVMAVVDIDVTYDIEGLQRRVHDLMPNEQIDIAPAGDNLVLSGHVSSSDHLHQIAVLAAGYAPQEKISNLLSIGGSQQVLLEVRFTEIARNALKDLGVSSNLTLKTGNSDAVGAATGPTGVPSPFGILTGAFSGSKFALSIEIDALESKGLLRTLAEPNLVALSGQTASFLAGGSFPVPVAQGTGTLSGGGNFGGAITVEFHDFGVGLGFTPTVIGRDLINLAVNSEVSSIDKSNAVTENGFFIPGLKVRRAKTMVELHDGESFAIAGLMQNDFQDALSQVPGLGNLPVIGALFRSTNFQDNQTELAVFITVHLVQPSVQRDLAAPTDTTLPPSELGLFGNGATQRNVPPKTSSTVPHGEVLP